MIARIGPVVRAVSTCMALAAVAGLAPIPAPAGAAGPRALLGPAPLAGQGVAHERTVPPPAEAGPDRVATDDARAILQRFVDAWRGPDEMTLEDTLVAGFRFSGPGGGEFHAIFSPDGGAELRDGLPADALFFHGDMEILRRLDRGEIAAMTAMGRARMSDRTPLDFGLPEGMRWTPRLQATLLPFVFHFWNREWPEVTRFGDGTTRFIHGGNAAIIYYDEGLRTGFYQLEPGMHINEPEHEQTNPFPSLFIITRGEMEARLGGIHRLLREGEAVLVPAGMSHEFWARDDQYGEMIMIAFGDGA